MKPCEPTKRLPPTLAHLHNILKIIRPNSIDAEIMFSAVMQGLLNKSLSDDTVDATAYLKLFCRTK